MTTRLAPGLGLLALSAALAAIVAAFSDTGGMVFVLLLVSVLSGIAGVSVAVVALNGDGRRRWLVKLGLGLSTAALVISLLVIALAVLLILVVLSGARQGG